MNVVVPPGVSGRAAKYDPEKVTHEMMANELQLMTLGDVVPLNMVIDRGEFMSEIAMFRNDWVDYLPRTDRPNNRQALAVTNLPGKSHRSNPSLAQACEAEGRKVNELEFNVPTPVYDMCPSLHTVLDDWKPLGRTFLVKANTGGYFVPHRDHPSLHRPSLRLIAFLNNCEPTQYDWFQEDDRKLQIEMGRVYYVNTRKTHRTISWVDNSIHLIMNIPMTTANVQRVVANLQHTH